MGSVHLQPPGQTATQHTKPSRSVPVFIPKKVFSGGRSPDVDELPQIAQEGCVQLGSLGDLPCVRIIRSLKVAGIIIPIFPS